MASEDAHTVAELDAPASDLKQIENEISQEIEFPDGGLRAWGTVFGVRTAHSNQRLRDLLCFQAFMINFSCCENYSVLGVQEADLLSDGVITSVRLGPSANNIACIH